MDEEVKKSGDEILKVCLKILKDKLDEEVLKKYGDEIAPDYFKTGEQNEGAKLS